MEFQHRPYLKLPCKISLIGIRMMPREGSYPYTSYELIERFIAGEIKFRGKDKSPSTLKAYKTSLASLKEFERKKKNTL